MTLTSWKRKSGTRGWEMAALGVWPPATWIRWPASTIRATATVSDMITEFFHQTIEDGWQREQCDNWARKGTPWEIRRGEYLIPVRFYGRTETFTDAAGRQCYRWVDGEVVMAMGCDILVPGFGDEFVTNMRLWKAQSSREFNLDEFNQGDYIGAVEAKVQSETISSVLYPSDEIEQGRELRLKQQYFFRGRHPGRYSAAVPEAESSLFRAF